MRRDSKITGSHLERVALVYVRQSTLVQVRDHTESTVIAAAFAAAALPATDALFVPADPDSATTAMISWLDRLAYVVETVVPVVDLGERDAWQIDTSAPYGTWAQAVQHVLDLLGWALGLLVVAAVTGVARDPEPVDRQRVVEPFAQRGRGTRALPGEAARERLKVSLGFGGGRLGPRRAQLALHRGALGLGQVIGDVSLLMTSAPLGEREWTVDVIDGLGDRLAAIDHEQHPRVASSPRADRSAIRRVQTAAFSVDPSTTPSGTLVPSSVTPNAPTRV